MSEQSVADLMRRWRKLLGINVADAGKQLALSPRSIEDIEQGRTRADDALTRIALERLVHDATHEAECRSAALAAVAERERKTDKRRK